MIYFKAYSIKKLLYMIHSLFAYLTQKWNCKKLNFSNVSLKNNLMRDNFIILNMHAHPALPVPFSLKRLSFLLIVSLHFYKNQLIYVLGLISGFSVLFHWAICQFLISVSYSLNYYRFVVCFEIRQYDI